MQQQGILAILNKKDVIIQSQSGTGKTTVFTLGILNQLNISLREPQALILSPTRELAEQSQKVALSLGMNMNISI